MERAKRYSGIATRHAGRGLPAGCERDHDAGRPRKNVSASCAEKTRVLTQSGVILSRSEVHVVPPFRESPRATGVIEKASATRLAPVSGSPVALRTRLIAGVRFATWPSLRRRRQPLPEGNCAVTVASRDHQIRAADARRVQAPVVNGLGR